MKKVILLAVFAFSGLVANAASYQVNDAQVETVLSTNVVDLEMGAVATLNVMSPTNVQGDNDVIIALVLDWFLGGLGIHRLYLGANPVIVAKYFFTCGGIFGIVPIVDFFHIIINGVDKMKDNDKLIAWGN